MRPEDLAHRIEAAFGSLDPPTLEEMAAAGTYVDEPFLAAVESKTWQELRPLRDHVGDGSELALLSPRAYQYYLPAYLYALIDEAGDEFYLNGVLDSLWWGPWDDSDNQALEDLFDPRKGWEEWMPELERQMPQLTDQERRIIAERRVSNAEKRALLKDLIGRDWHDRSCLRELWEERIPLLTHQQKECIARILVHILERTADPLDTSHVRTALDAYWGAYLDKPGDPVTDAFSCG